ncbi:hypothetical protein G3480_06365 [Thiorhodococcus mannitoliphagus]|uniref:Uncharacterized protein n=1 Tax=Thiorhodococcus mannitoliphagus TaxID=329406 RepID=A0A6P1DPL2_9GAMM|nr:hypothetical protein [Thiorhodococcus mannitoliphagus]NEX19938.1 hypothetical protein [Thiorhodococcus mannitoliphagus]
MSDALKAAIARRRMLLRGRLSRHRHLLRARRAMWSSAIAEGSGDRSDRGQGMSARGTSRYHVPWRLFVLSRP